MSKAIEDVKKIAFNIEMNGIKCFGDEFRNIIKELQRLEAIENSNPSEALKYVNGKIADLEDDLQHYTMVDKDKCREFYIREDLKQFTNIQQSLLKSQEQEEDIIHYKGTVDNLRRDNALLKDIKNEQEKILKIIFEKQVDIHLLKACITCYVDSLNAYNSEIKKLHSNHKDYQNKPLSFYLLIQEEFDLLKSWLENEQTRTSD